MLKSCIGGVSLLTLAACTTIPAQPGVASHTAVPALGAVEVQLLAVNDFHGSLETPGGATSYRHEEQTMRAVLGGATRLGATLASLRSGQEHSVTVAAGDLVGASPFVSANYLDEPAVMALRMAGLDLAAVGNHEFDRGVPELRRIQQGGCERFTTRTPCALDQFAGAGFAYLAGNVVDGQGNSVFPGSVLRQVGPVQVGFIGLTLRDTATLVSPSATAGYRFLDEADTANRLARDLVARGADTVVLLIHEGGRVDPGQNVAGCPSLTGPIVPIIARLDPEIALVVSGHTHMSYVCRFDLPSGGQRLLSSAGRYGAFVTNIRLRIDPAGGPATIVEAQNVPVTAATGEQADIAGLVARYAAAAAPVAARVVGRIAPAPSPATPDPDCIDSAATNLVADAQLAAANRALGAGAADVAFINTGGVRTGMAGADDGVMTYGEIFAMQPFGNVLQVLEMSGADLAAVLEEQFCGTGVAAACFSQLVPSANLTYTFDRSRPTGERVTSITLDGAPLQPARNYRVVFNNFLANGGDGFASLARQRTVGEAGVDLDALEAWIARGAEISACGRVRDLTAS